MFYSLGIKFENTALQTRSFVRETVHRRKNI